MTGPKRISYLLPARVVVLGATIAILVAMVGTAAAAAVASADSGSGNFRGEQDLGLAARPAAVSSVDTGAGNFRGEQDLGSAVQRGATSQVTEALQPGQTVSAAVSDTGGYNANGQWVPGSVGETLAPTGGYNAEGQWVPGSVGETVTSPVFGATPWTPASGPAEALQPGQTASLVIAAAAVGNTGGYDAEGQWVPGSVGETVSSPVYGPTPWSPASGPAEALQPGQTASLVTSGNVDFSIGDPTAMTSALGPTEALQPGQTYSMVGAQAAGYDPAHEHLASADGSGSTGDPTPTEAPQPGQTGW